MRSGGAGAQLFARTWRLSGSSFPARDVLDDIVENLVPQIALLEGYRGGNLLVDRDCGDIIATTFWDSLEHLAAGQERAANAAAGTLVISEGSTMQVSVCDVLYNMPPSMVVDRDLGPAGD
jgi:hypothetical protein